MRGEATVVFGLGNPGWRYRRTRHNVGFGVVEEMARRHRARWRRLHPAGCGVWLARMQCAGRPVLLVEPQTYMNRSGLAVRALMAAGANVAGFDIDIDDLLVVVDDVDLPLGRLRVRRGGSDGGHNGLRSIVETVATTEFARIRVGVGGSRDGDLTDHVLGKFGRSERLLVRRVVIAAADAVEMIVEQGLGPAMNAFNGMDLAASPAAGPARPVEE
ncbi:MAG: aminoacyl-tRNA hydrolase [Verrucomicrobia bacterium]|nr:aminoacyl-tRNA hydrolase [Verrucomicrobiota bacterium]